MIAVRGRAWITAAPYLAAFQYRYDRCYRLADMIERLAGDAPRTPATPYWLLELAEVGA